ncbi:MAG: LysM peptidoglycan-binding domain-containing protein [Schleiferiaceae bacterium]
MIKAFLEALSLGITMKKSTQIIMLFFLLLSAGSTSVSAYVADTLRDITWEIEGESGAFSPAGWASEEVLALTRVQAVRMGLKINEFVDERFDPVKGKCAALLFCNKEILLETAESFQYEGGHLLLEDLADEAGIPLRSIEEANPHLRRDILPAGATLYAIALAMDESKLSTMSASQSKYQENLEAQYEQRQNLVLSFMPDPNTHRMITYTVRSGDYLGKISANTGATLDDIHKWNRISGNTIYVGQKLIIWVPKSSTYEQSEAEVAEHSPKKASKAVAKAVPSNEASYITYEVKPGDTLWDIAKKFPGVSADNIKTWNKVDELIKAGEKLRIQTQTISDYSPDKYPSTL